MFETDAVYQYIVIQNGPIMKAVIRDWSTLVGAQYHEGKGWWITGSSFSQDGPSIPGSASFKDISYDEDGEPFYDWETSDRRYFPSFEACVDYVAEWFGIKIEKVESFKAKNSELIRT